MTNSQVMDDCWPTEESYQEYLLTERRLFAWCLVRYGAFAPDVAATKAEMRYPYEPPDAPYRGMIFHELAWEWAMIELHGHGYSRKQPHLRRMPDEYRLESQRSHGVRLERDESHRAMESEER